MGYDKKLMPEDFPEHRHERLIDLRKRYHASARVIHRWNEELGYPNTRSHPINQYSKDGRFIRHYESVTEAAKAVYGGIGHIGDCAHGRIQTAYGYVWILADEDERWNNGGGTK